MSEKQLRKKFGHLKLANYFMVLAFNFVDVCQHTEGGRTKDIFNYRRSLVKNIKLKRNPDHLI